MNEITLTKNVNLNLTPQQLNIILTHLRTGRYDHVSGLIQEIEKQVMAQITQVTQVTKIETNAL